MRLIAFGCSNTYGQGLPDIWDFENNTPVENSDPSKLAWPQILADKLGIECINLGVPGASNKEIWWNAITCTTRMNNHKSIWHYEKTDIVVINWSFLPRWWLISKGNENGHIDQIKFHKKNSLALKSFIKYIYNEEDSIIDLYLRCNHLYFFLKNKIKSIYFCQQETLIQENQSARKLVLKFNETSFLKTYFTNIINRNPKAHDDSHPGVDAHKIFANEIHNEITNDKM